MTAVRPYQPYFLEDLSEGQEFETPRRTVTETDLVTFAMLSSDWNTVHTDALSSAESDFGRRIVHGALGLTLTTGLLQRTGMFEGSAVALLGFAEWMFDRPLYVGDTVHTRLRITSVRRTSKGDRGVIGRELALVNQHGEVVQHGKSDFMVWSRSSAPRENQAQLTGRTEE
ncbi:MAG TPA: MaoC/PaaZ C-terminal domain-containing protein [Trebonia sp.]